MEYILYVGYTFGAFIGLVALIMVLAEFVNTRFTRKFRVAVALVLHANYTIKDAIKYVNKEM